MKKGILIIAVLILVGIIGVFAQSTNPWSADASGKEKNVFLPSDSVYVSSYTVCFGTNNISLYIMSAASLSAGAKLSDVRGSYQEIKTSGQGFITTTKIGSNFSSGDYLIVLDCNRNGVYDANEPVDDASKAGFSIAVVGTGNAEKGAKSPADFTFTYDYELGNKEAKMVQVELSAEKENMDIKSLEIQANGTGNDLSDIEKVIVYADGNRDGEKEGVIGQGMFTSDNGKITIVLANFSVSTSVNKNIIISYVMKNFVEGKTYSFNLTSISAIGNTSGQKVILSGLPISSAVETIGKAKTCVGQIKLSLSSNISFVGENVSANVSGIVNCSSSVFIKLLSCNNNVSLCSCAGDNCSCKFASPLTAGSYTIFSCIDKNGDSVYNESGEVGEAGLNVKIKEVPKNVTIITNATNVTIQNITTNGSIITGDVINVGNKTSENGASFDMITVLSIGMIIIFVILVVILVMLFKLAGKK